MFAAPCATSAQLFSLTATRFGATDALHRST